MRAAIYFTPPADDPLTRAAALWLGRDAFSGAPTRAADPVIDPLVADPARYGFHATLRAPFRLADGVALADVERDLISFAAGRRPFVLPSLALARLDGFVALVPGERSAELGDLEGAVLETFDRHRAPLSEAEIVRRRPERLSERQRRNLERWGYTFVRDEFRFHLTLTNSLADETADAAEALLRRRFAAFDGAPLRIGAIALFVEAAPGVPFVVRAAASFGS